MNAIALTDDVAKKNLELVGTYIPYHQKKLLEDWATEDRRSVSNLVAGILLDVLIEHFGAAKVEEAKSPKASATPSDSKTLDVHSIFDKFNSGKEKRSADQVYDATPELHGVVSKNTFQNIVDTGKKDPAKQKKQIQAFIVSKMGDAAPTTDNKGN